MAGDRVDIVDAMDAIDLVDHVNDNSQNEAARSSSSSSAKVTPTTSTSMATSTTEPSNADNNDGGGGEEEKDDADFAVFEQDALTLEGETVGEALAEADAAAAAAEAHAVVYDDDDDVNDENNHNQQSNSSLPPLGEEAAGTESGHPDTNLGTTGGNISPSSPKRLSIRTTPTSPVNRTVDRSRYVTPKDFELLKVIGMGAFGKVLQVKNKQSSQILAMKVISKRLLRRKTGYIENVQAERNILKRINHPFVVKMHCSFQTREKLFIVMDFLAGGELFLRLGREGIFLEKDAAFYLGEIILGLDHLHQTGIIHRDLKPENILLSNDNHVCLTDFGLAKDFGPDWGKGSDGDGEEERALTICGTQEYMAPEMVANKGYGRAADWWSVGCIAYEMLNGLPPFSSKQGSKELFRRIMSEKVKMPPGSTAAACKLLKGLLNRNPDARLGAAKSTMFEVGGVTGLKRSPFFDKIDFDKLERKEIEPPYAAKVECEEKDLRHFHDEFTNMPLPRSVKEMSKEKHVARRVNSETFRGFSFIQSDYLLPERDAAEMDLYWNSQPDEDGESNSDLASSKCDTEEKPPEKPEKKKRPPRKRKKKKQQQQESDAVSETATNESSLPDVSPAPITVTDDDGAKGNDLCKKDTDVKDTNLPAKQQSTSPEPTKPREKVLPGNIPAWPKRTPRSADHPPTRNVVPTSSPAPASKAVENTWQSVESSTKKNDTRPKYQPPHLRNPQAAAKITAGSRPSWNQGVKYPNPVRTPAAPGSWAARLQSAAPTSLPSMASSTKNATSQTNAYGQRSGAMSWNNSRPPPPQHGDEPPPSPSSDWRNHASPQVRKAIHRSSLQSSSATAAASSAGSGAAWPSLNNVPPAPTLRQKPGQNDAKSFPSLKATQPKALQGAWASRSKS